MMELPEFSELTFEEKSHRYMLNGFEIPSVTTILTTNLSLKEMKENTDIRYARIYDRVFEMCYPMKCDGASRRRMEARDRFNKMKSFFEGEYGGV